MKLLGIKEKKLGIVSLFLGAFFFSLFGVLTRLLDGQMNVFTQIFLRTFIVALIFLIVGVATKSFLRIKRKDLITLIFRGVLIVIDFVSFYFAVTNLSLGLTLFIFYAASIVSNYAYGYFFFKEKLSFIKILSLVLAVLGLFIILSNNIGVLKFFPMILAFISGICFGMEMSSSKSISDKYSIVQINLIAYLVAAFLISLLFAQKISFSFNLNGWFYIFIFSIITILASYLVILGFKFIETQKAGLILLSELIFVVLIGFIIYGEILSLITILGCLLILVALSLPNLNFKKLIYNK